MEKCGEHYGGTTGNDHNRGCMGLLNGTQEVHAPKSETRAYTQYIHTYVLLRIP